jgi:hypothetical protein
VDCFGGVEVSGRVGCGMSHRVRIVAGPWAAATARESAPNLTLQPTSGATSDTLE